VAGVAPERRNWRGLVPANEGRKFWPLNDRAREHTERLKSKPLAGIPFALR
jgi:hypothetical protein